MNAFVCIFVYLHNTLNFDNIFQIFAFPSFHLLFILLDCGSPNSPGNGTVELTDAGTTTYGATATQSCNTGFYLTGVTNITCGADGSWSEAAVTCTFSTFKGNLHIVTIISQLMQLWTSYRSFISLELFWPVETLVKNIIKHLDYGNNIKL